jgi:hypothetical protein
MTLLISLFSGVASFSYWVDNQLRRKIWAPGWINIMPWQTLLLEFYTQFVFAHIPCYLEYLAAPCDLKADNAVVSLKMSSPDSPCFILQFCNVWNMWWQNMYVAPLFAFYSAGVLSTILFRIQFSCGKCISVLLFRQQQFNSWRGC